MLVKLGVRGEAASLLAPAGYAWPKSGRTREGDEEDGEGEEGEERSREDGGDENQEKKKRGEDQVQLEKEECVRTSRSPGFHAGNENRHHHLDLFRNLEDTVFMVLIDN